MLAMENEVPKLLYRIQVMVTGEDIYGYESPQRRSPGTYEHVDHIFFDDALREGKVWWDCHWITGLSSLEIAQMALENTRVRLPLEKFRLVIHTEL
jgi:hypothetical protein